MTYTIASLYKFTPLEDIPSLRTAIYAYAEKHAPSVCGTLLLAPEGINGTIGAHEDDLKRMVGYLHERFGILDNALKCKDGEIKYSRSQDKPFNRFKVRPKKEIITMRQPDANPHERVGDYVEAKDWNDFIADPDVTLIDTRNEYETRVGIFKGAIDPKMDVFTEFPDWVEKNLDPEKNKKVAMFCTGGIRCEKASSYMLAQGFEEVYHLKGGILQYLETIPAEESKWDGECFVFDHRVSVGHGLEEGEWSVCHGCREPLSHEDTQREEYEKGICCHHCAGNLTAEREKSLRARNQHYAELSD